MTATPRTDEAFASYCTLTLLICSRELEIENATLRDRIKDLELERNKFREYKGK